MTWLIVGATILLVMGYLAVRSICDSAQEALFVMTFAVAAFAVCAFGVLSLLYGLHQTLGG